MMILRVSLVCLALASAACAVSLNKRETAQKAPEARADYSPPSYGGGGGGGGAAAHGAGGAHGGTQGNLYYYYYPVQEHAGYQTTAGRDDDFSGLLGILLPLFIICCCCMLVLPLFSGGSTVISTGGYGRRRRDEEPELPYRDSVAELKSELNRLFFLYLNAVESEQCPERIFCEVGTYAGSLSGKDFIFRMIETFDIIPEAFKSKFRVMQKAALTGKDMSICKKYLCHPPKLISKN